MRRFEFSHWLILTPFVHGFEWSPGFPPTCSLSRGMLGTCIVWHTSRTWRRRVSQLKWVWARFDQDLSGHHNVGCFQTLISLIQCHLTKLGDLNACGIFGSWWHCFCDINISLWCISPCKMSLGVSPIVFFFAFLPMVPSHRQLEGWPSLFTSNGGCSTWMIVPPGSCWVFAFPASDNQPGCCWIPTSDLRCENLWY